MKARGTSAGCAGSSSSCCATARSRPALAVIVVLTAGLLACGNARPPPPAHLDPEYADAGPPILIHDPWPQTGPFYCHSVVATDGTRAGMCARSSASCKTWRESNQRKGFEVGMCTDELEASCFVDQQLELCFRTLDKCEEVRDAMGAPGLCTTIRAAWQPE